MHGSYVTILHNLYFLHNVFNNIIDILVSILFFSSNRQNNMLWRKKKDLIFHYDVLNKEFISFSIGHGEEIKHIFIYLLLGINIYKKCFSMF